MDTNCAPLLAALFLYSYKADFIQGLLKKNEKKLARSFNLTFRYIDDVHSLNNSRFIDFVDRIYPIKLEIKDTTDTDRHASYLDLHLEIDSEGWLRTKLYDKRDDFNFPIVNFPFVTSLIMISFSTNQQKTFKSSYFKICTQLIEHSKCATKIILFSFLQSVMAKLYLLKIKYLYLFIILFSLAIH